MAEYSRLAKGTFTATGTASSATSAVITLPFTPDYVELWNYTNIKTAAINRVSRAWWDNKLVDGTTNPTMAELYASSTTSTVFDTVPTNGISTFQAGVGEQYGTKQQVVSIIAATGVVTVTAHGYSVGDTVIFQGLAIGAANDMQLLNGIPFTIVTVPSVNTFTIQWNTDQSNYADLTSSPAGSYVKKVLYPFLYLPEANYISAITEGAVTTVVTTMYHNFEPGQEIAFRIPPFWGAGGFNSLPNILIPGSPIYGYVTSVTDNWTFVCNINSSSFSAFTTNQTPLITIAGLQYPQVVAVGDVNTGGLGIYTAGVNGFLTNSPLYPPPNFPTSTNRVPTINGPAIKGAFVNNTSQGFIIGAGLLAADTSATLIRTGDVVLWHAYLHDYSNP